MNADEHPLYLFLEGELVVGGGNAHASANTFVQLGGR